MRVLQSWLHDFISFKIPPDVVAEKLSMLGLEIENVEHLGQRYRGFVVGAVREVNRHPNADKLTVCRVDTGTEQLQIVCGAPNVAAGQKVVVGLVGATIPRNQHDPEGKPFDLSKVRIRGVESSGMICSEYELDLGKDADGILVLRPDAPVGKALAAYLGLDDVALDIEITPNRPDWLSHLGVAREIAVLVGRQPNVPAVRLTESATPIKKFLSISVQDKENCPRFAARMLRGVRIAPSPDWLQHRLRNAGLRPRNNIVDITNYVMLECGHPLHAFDYTLLRQGKIIVRQARPGTAFTTLDGKQYALPENAVMVCDGEREVSIAGIMGGENSEINDSTVDVVVESAYWNPSSIRRTAKRLGITTDASQRFERGADPHAVRYALDRATALILEIAGGKLLKGLIDEYPRPIRERIVPLRPARVNAVLGTRLTSAAVIRCLRLLGIVKVGKTSEALRFRIPTYRVDIDREIDLIEEVARVYGYNRIEEKTTATVDIAHPFPRSGSEDRVREVLIGAGFQEVITNSMETNERASLGGATPVRILNPQNQEMTHLRSSLLPGMLDVVQRNQSFGNTDLRLFQIGHVFCVDDSNRPKIIENFLEETRVCLLLSGSARRRHWSVPPRVVDVFDLKGEVEDFLARLSLDKGRLFSYSTSNGLTDDTLTIEIHGSYAGYLGHVKKDVLKRFGVEQDAYVAEMNVSSLERRDDRSYVQLPRFPKVRRDVAFIVNDEVSAAEMEKAIWKTGSELLQRVELFDLYRGEPLRHGTKSLAFTLELISREKTLTEQEIETEVKRIVQRVEQSVGATLRSVS
jgi:phenylalanyl-tRNA synthetase beta chain